MYVSGVHRYPTARYDPNFGLGVSRGTERFGLFFDGPTDETLSLPQASSLFFYTDAKATRQAYRAKLARLEKATAKLPSEQRVLIRRMLSIGRNAVILWDGPYAPQRLRAIVRGCLRP